MNFSFDDVNDVPQRLDGETDASYVIRAVIWIEAVTEGEWLCIDAYAELIKDGCEPRQAAIDVVLDLLGVQEALEGAIWESDITVTRSL